MVFQSENESHSVMSNSLRPHELYIQSMEFSRLEYWNGQPFISPDNLPNPGIKPRCPTLHADSLPAEPPGKSTVFQATLCNTEVKSLNHVRLCDPMDYIAYQAPPSMEFSRQEYWSGLPFPSPGDLPDPGIEPGSPALQIDALPSEPPGKPTLDYAKRQNYNYASRRCY